MKFATTQSAGQWVDFASGKYPYDGQIAPEACIGNPRMREIGDFPHTQEIDFMRDSRSMRAPALV
jgi:hypothetical protein